MKFINRLEMLNMTNDSMLDLLMNAYDNQQRLSEILNNDSISQAIHGVCESTSEIKIWIAKALVFDYENEKAVDFLCELANEEDADVRVEAIDSLSAFQSSKSYHTLCGAICDPDELVRAYAA